MTPDERALRREIVVGRGAALRLQDVRGVERVRVTEYGAPDGPAMVPGTVFAEVWATADPAVVLESVQRHSPAGVLVVCAVRPARARHRLGAWARWTAYRARAWWRRKLGA